MALIESGTVSKIYTVSTGLKPPSCVADSYGTPTGIHAIADKIGGNQPEGIVFKGRQPAKHFPNTTVPKPLNTDSRIMRLRGLEPGKNSGAGCDKLSPAIFTSMALTTKKSDAGGGCIELCNADVIELFERQRRSDRDLRGLAQDSCLCQSRGMESVSPRRVLTTRLVTKGRKPRKEVKIIQTAPSDIHTTDASVLPSIASCMLYSPSSFSPIP